ncbi:hypothetical protein PMES_01482 [Profundibacterium mesophilum KAUST100406-0324]|uniref:Uncharacterized protein n=1 Tax=Profundibacterium mesophilum KAUST100406-0324 TaxID=1037889 RepID=A0A921NZ38_9RHOB|nr:hypothetical protein PMES_01482 [Profundibacterium mesophilum KAUST100406-0324]
MLRNGKWVADWQPVQAKDEEGGFVRQTSSFRNWVTPDGRAGPTGDGGFQAELGRYHLFVALARAPVRSCNHPSGSRPWLARCAPAPPATACSEPKSRHDAGDGSPGMSAFRSPTSPHRTCRECQQSALLDGGLRRRSGDRASAANGGKVRIAEFYLPDHAAQCHRRPVRGSCTAATGRPIGGRCGPIAAVPQLATRRRSRRCLRSGENFATFHAWSRRCRGLLMVDRKIADRKGRELTVFSDQLLGHWLKQAIESIGPKFCLVPVGHRKC